MDVAKVLAGVNRDEIAAEVYRSSATPRKTVVLEASGGLTTQMRRTAMRIIEKNVNMPNVKSEDEVSNIANVCAQP